MPALFVLLKPDYTSGMNRVIKKNVLLLAEDKYKAHLYTSIIVATLAIILLKLYW